MRPKGARWSPNGAVSRLKIEAEFVVSSGSEKVVDLEFQKLESRTRRTSKINKIHRRGCVFPGFALLSDDLVFKQFSYLERDILGAFWA